MRPLAVPALLLLVSGCGGTQAERKAETTAEAKAPPPPASACQSDSFEGTPLTHCIADPAQHRIAMALGPKDAAPYRSLRALAGDRNITGVAFAMNGGMFDDAGQPIGYYVENGERRHKLNRAKGGGNFHLKPNGVFYGTGNAWAVRSADDFARYVTRRPEFGTQSGPMLVIHGKLHPKIAEDGDSHYVRNAVGVDRGGRAHFVISDAPLSFGKLARYYRDKLAVPDALFLDGNVSALWDPVVGRLDQGRELGPLIVVTKAAKGQP